MKVVVEKMGVAQAKIVMVAVETVISQKSKKIRRVQIAPLSQINNYMFI